jgi:WhiB family redox-sensing transcriptional regulator
LAAREPYGVWGGFTESERVRLLATGWEDLSERVRGRVDIKRLEARLGLVPRTLPTAGLPTAGLPHQLGPRRFGVPAR